MSTVNKSVEKLLIRIKSEVDNAIDRLKVNSVVKQAMKNLATQQINKIPDTVRKANTQRYVASLLKNPMVRQNEMLQKQIGTAYWAVKTAIQPSSAARKATIQELLDFSCPQMSEQKKQAISTLIKDQCADYQCDPQKYWEIFQQVDAACWVGLLEKASIKK